MKLTKAFYETGKDFFAFISVRQTYAGFLLGGISAAMVIPSSGPGLYAFSAIILLAIPFVLEVIKKWRQ